MAHRDEATRPLASAARTGLLATFALLFAGAHAPWLRAGFTAEDLAVRLASTGGFASAWSELLPLPAPGAAAPWARLEALLCVSLFALGTSHFLRRLLAPWVGKERARTTAFLTLVFALLHPLLGECAAPEAARGARLALALAGVASGFFLAGRQEGREGRTAGALALFLLAGFFSADAAPLALLFALAEFTSAHRHRPRGLRLRTAATTLLVFAAAAFLPRLLATGGSALAVREPMPEPRALLVAGLQELGRLCIPAPASAGVLALLGCGAVLLLVFQPLFRAARSAPRLWGGLFACWSVVLGLALVWWSCADPARGAAGRELLALAVLCTGFALSASALSAERARWITLAAALLFAPIAHAAARPRLAAGELAGTWQRTLQARIPEGSARVFVLDPPGAELPGELAANLGWLLHPRLPGAARASASQNFDPWRVRAIETQGLVMLLRSASAVPLGGARVLFPDGELSTLGIPRAATDLAGLQPWRSELGTTFEDGLDPRSLAAVEVTAELATQPSELARLAWRSRDGRTGTVAGSVREQRGRRVAHYDLSTSLAWFLAGEVRSLELPDGKRAIERAEFRARLPQPAGNPVPLRDGADWLFLLEPFEASEVELTLLELDGFRLMRRALTRAASGRLAAQDVGPFLDAAGRAAAPVLWTLEFRSDGRVLARLAGTWSEVP